MAALHRDRFEDLRIFILQFFLYAEYVEFVPLCQDLWLLREGGQSGTFLPLILFVRAVFGLTVIRKDYLQIHSFLFVQPINI